MKDRDDELVAQARTVSRRASAATADPRLPATRIPTSGRRSDGWNVEVEKQQPNVRVAEPAPIDCRDGRSGGLGSGVRQVSESEMLRLFLDALQLKSLRVGSVTGLTSARRASTRQREHIRDPLFFGCEQQQCVLLCGGRCRA